MLKQTVIFPAVTYLCSSKILACAIHSNQTKGKILLVSLFACFLLANGAEVP